MAPDSYFRIFTGMAAPPRKTYGTGSWYSLKVDRVISVGPEAEARGEANIDLSVGGRFGISSPLRKRPGLKAMILK
jgi:hypothetical protein